METALVMPFFVFLSLAILQLGLAHQARLMTKYAAFRAARVGTMTSASWDQMDTAALQVLMPFASRGARGGDEFFPGRTASQYASSWRRIERNQLSAPVPWSVVKICNPTLQNFAGTGEGEAVEFDDPGAVGSDWYGYNRTRLNVQVTFFYRMPIPFANQVLWWIARGGEDQETMRLLRMNNPDGAASPVTYTTVQGYGTRVIARDKLLELARQGEYLLPIKASYGLRMQSDLYPEGIPGHELPRSSECSVPWKKGPRR